MKNSHQTTEELINEKISDLHEKGSGDYETLLRQVNKKYKTIRYNPAQMAAKLAMMSMEPKPNKKGNKPGRTMTLLWGRGTGKTTFMGDHAKECAIQMPRGTGMLLSPTYKMALTRTLPSMIQGLEQMGIFKDLHYFVGRRPPRNWNWLEAYQPPQSYKNFIPFWTGFGWHIISQDVPGDGRALNADAEMGDEAALLDKKKMDENTGPALRGSNKRAFQDKPLFVSRLYCTSMPLTSKGRWILDQKEHALMHPDHIRLIKANAKDTNYMNLSDTYFEDAKRRTLPMIYDAEYLNIEPTIVKDGFYPLLDEDLHSYNQFNYDHYHSLGVSQDCRGDADLVSGKPLIMGVDWGASINCAVVCQHVSDEFRALKNFYVLGDDKKIQEDLFKDFHDYYKHHKSRTIYLWYDHTGNIETGFTKRTRAERAKKQLEDLGWTVRLMTRGRSNPEHARKYLLWTLILKESETRMPVFRVNKSNCKELWVSMTNAQTKQTSRGEIKKDKSSEKLRSLDRQYATDLSDAIDSPVFGMFSDLLHSTGNVLPDDIIHTH